ncbi:MAG: AAA family ATPase [Polyangiaceae bacterium]|nr:AAA family ATPase [Polyangiaceae bacterium]
MSMLAFMSSQSDSSLWNPPPQVLACVGPGGVGKTTVAAGLALLASSLGQRVLCLTIDPARRLAQSLGVQELGGEAVRIEGDSLSAHGLSLSGELAMMMLEPGSVFDSLVRRYAESADVAERILSHRLYREVATHLPGTHEYMALERVLQSVAEDKYDIVILDTPPSARALDFFDAPQRLLSALDSPLTRTLSRAVSGSGFGGRLISKGIRSALATMGKVTGAGFLEELAELLQMMQGLLSGLRGRASEAEALLHSSAVKYLLVSGWESSQLAETERLATEMNQRGLAVEQLVMNRSVRPPGRGATDADAFRLGHELDLEKHELEGVLQLNRELGSKEADLATRQKALLQAQQAKLANLPMINIPDQVEDVNEPRALVEIVRLLAAQT